MKTRTNKRKSRKGGAALQLLQPLQLIVVDPDENEVLVVQARNLANNAIQASNHDLTNRDLRNAAIACIQELDSIIFHFYPDALPSLSPQLTRQNAMYKGGGYYKRKTNKKRKTKRR